MNYKELETLVKQWGIDKGIVGVNNSRNQLLKFFEEAGELSRATLKGNKADQIDAVGDVMVTLILYCANESLDVMECLESAYNVIKNRKGKTENGIFKKYE